MIIEQSDLTWPYTPACDMDKMGLTPAQQAVAVALGTEWLWMLTARRYGVRTVVDRPATSATWRCFADVPPYLVSMYGSLAWPFDTDPRTGYVSSRQWVELARDASAVTAVTITAPATTAVPSPPTVVVDPSAYRLEGNYLVRQDGGEWPQTQDMIAALGSPNTWSVAYSRGVPPSAWGQYAAGLLIQQFAQAIIGDTNCKLPYNVLTAARSGVTITKNVLKAASTTGIALVDQYVAAENPNALQSPGSVWSPDVSRNQPPYRGSYLGS